jgi:hypothetical protein
MQGKLQVGNTRIDLRREEAGLYLLTVKGGAGFRNQVRIVKQ